MKKFIAYYRVSTTKQGLSGLGLESQEQAVSDYATRTGGEIVSSFTDVESGSKDNRPQLQKALRECRLSGATLLIAKLDRLSRNRNFLLLLADSTTDFICADMPEANSLTIGLMACMADYERQLISERTKSALAMAKKRGVILGNPNLAEVRNTDTTNATKARSEKAQARNKELMQVINELIESTVTKLSLREIAKKLNNAGYRTATGRDFQATTVNRIMSA